MLSRVKQILSVELYEVTCLWNTGEVRAIDLQSIIATSKPQSQISKLQDAAVFNQVKTDGRTLYWDDLLVMIDYDGSRRPAPLDLDPDVLYQQSRLVGRA
ncbi:DUF2442 domain-containing protein [Larkinella soli]|uniref:DUF2442 domain-containing protein n=1 Tax=Larkinella soli TaxID=1770527 RepID=UPI000FFB48FF|nr:DUF2442 domain-containing protein [Larkinella soli]